MGRTQGKEGHKYSALLRHTDCVTPKLSIIIIIVIKSGVKAAAKLFPSLSRHIFPMVLLFLEHWSFLLSFGGPFALCCGQNGPTAEQTKASSRWEEVSYGVGSSVPIDSRSKSYVQLNVSPSAIGCKAIPSCWGSIFFFTSSSKCSFSSYIAGDFHCFSERG